MFELNLTVKITEADIYLFIFERESLTSLSVMELSGHGRCCLLAAYPLCKKGKYQPPNVSCNTWQEGIA